MTKLTTERKRKHGDLHRPIKVRHRAVAPAYQWVKPPPYEFPEAKQPAPNEGWCVGCDPETCQGCGLDKDQP